MLKLQYIKRLKDNKIFYITDCIFFHNFKQVLIRPGDEHEFILKKDEFEIVEEEITSFELSYEENITNEEKFYKILLKLEKEFENNYPEPENWESDKYGDWFTFFTNFLEEGLKNEGFNHITFEYK